MCVYLCGIRSKEAPRDTQTRRTEKAFSPNKASDDRALSHARTRDGPHCLDSRAYMRLPTAVS